MSAGEFAAAKERLAPAYTGLGLASVLPSVVRSLGVRLDAHPVPLLDLPAAPRAVVVLVDGLGLELLRQRSGHAPVMRSALGQARALSAGFPSTTATSMGTFGTGLPPGAHGLVGYQVLVPDRDALLNELAWDVNVNPVQWQPNSTLLERAAAAGVPVTMVGPHYFDGSGLTTAALRGATFAGAMALDARVERAVQAIRATPRGLVYLYWGDVDKAGHVHGVNSTQWTEQVEIVDAAIGRLLASVPPDTAVYVTADHGMVDCPHDTRIDLAARPELRTGIRHLGGEPRAPQLYAEPGAAADLLQVWREALGERALVLARDEAIEAGWFGPVVDAVRPRIGDVVVATLGDLSIVDTATMRPQLVALIGLHGSVSAAETAIPLLRFAPRSEAS